MATDHRSPPPCASMSLFLLICLLHQAPIKIPRQVIRPSPIMAPPTMAAGISCLNSYSRDIEIVDLRKNNERGRIRKIY